MSTPAATTPEPGIGAAVANSAFFNKLPAELRIVIYHLALVDDFDVIEIGQDPCSLPFEPGLLCTCCMVRKEASSIFHIYNTFVLHVWYYSAAACCYFVNTVRRLPADFDIEHRVTVYMELDGANNWHNLMGWLRCVHDGSAVKLGPDVIFYELEGLE